RSLAVRGCLCTLALFAARSLAAQGTISGRITTEGNTPLPEARVLLPGGTASAMTGEDGRYTLRNVPAGSVEIQALHVGYQSLKKIVNVANNATVSADFVMKQAIVQLQEVV